MMFILLMSFICCSHGVAIQDFDCFGPLIGVNNQEYILRNHVTSAAAHPCITFVDSNRITITGSFNISTPNYQHVPTLNFKNVSDIYLLGFSSDGGIGFYGGTDIYIDQVNIIASTQYNAIQIDSSVNCKITNSIISSPNGVIALVNVTNATVTDNSFYGSGASLLKFSSTTFTNYSGNTCNMGTCITSTTSATSITTSTITTTSISTTATTDLTTSTATTATTDATINTTSTSTDTTNPTTSTSTTATTDSTLSTTSTTSTTTSIGSTITTTTTSSSPATSSGSTTTPTTTTTASTPTVAPTPNCDSKNGGCDYHVLCVPDGSGNVTCSGCPNGTYPSDSTCLLYCSDQICNADIGEDCVTCPIDCSALECGVCGDGYCDKLTETCSNCSKDCGPCKNQKCEFNCQGHGKCDNGLCTCENPWTGPYCSVSSTAPANFTVNNASLNAGVSTDSPQGPVHFKILIKSISEINSQNIPLRTISLPEVDFSFLSVVQNSNTINNYSATLENGAILNVTMWQFANESTTISFAGTTTNFGPHTLKIALTIQNWPFYNLGNSLAIVMDSSSGDDVTACVNYNADENGNLRWYVVVVDDVSLYGQFFDKAVVDGRVQTISYRYDEASKTISAILPHFWFIAELDPNFSVLLEDKTAKGDKCGENKSKKSKTKQVAIAVPVAIVVVGSIVAIAVFWPKIHRWWKVRTMHSVKSHDDIDIDIEKRGDMEVYTASGKFDVQM